MKTNKNDVALKKDILAVGLDKVYNQARKRSFLAEKYGEVLDSDPVWDFLEKYGYDNYRVCRNICKSQRQKEMKCRDKVGTLILSGSAYFLTLTFTDEVLASTTYETRRRYVSRTLKKLSHLYVANIDYGDKNGREHYHAVVMSDGKPDLSKWEKKRGFVCVEKIGSATKDAKKVCKYVAKLSRHALKKSTSRGEYKVPPRLIYSRHPYGFPPFFLFDDE